MHSRRWQCICAYVPAHCKCVHMYVSVLHMGVWGNYSYEFLPLFSSVDELTHKSPSLFLPISPAFPLFLFSSVSFSGQMLQISLNKIMQLLAELYLHQTHTQIPKTSQFVSNSLFLYCNAFIVFALLVFGPVLPNNFDSIQNTEEWLYIYKHSSWYSDYYNRLCF